MIVGFAGLAGSGKTTAASLLVTNRGFERHAFADPIRCMLSALGVPPAIMQGTQAQKLQPLKQLGGHTYRFAAQTLGDEWGRQIMGHDFWVQAWKESPPTGDVRVVCDDVRYQAEVDVIRDLGGIVIRLHRKGAGTTNPEHTSEQPHLLSRISFDLSNNVGLPLFRANLLEVVDTAYLNYRLRSLEEVANR